MCTCHVNEPHLEIEILPDRSNDSNNISNRDRSNDIVAVAVGVLLVVPGVRSAAKNEWKNARGLGRERAGTLDIDVFLLKKVYRCRVQEDVVDSFTEHC